SCRNVPQLENPDSDPGAFAERYGLSCVVPIGEKHRFFGLTNPHDLSGICRWILNCTGQFSSAALENLRVLFFPDDSSSTHRRGYSVNRDSAVNLRLSPVI